MGPWLPRAYCVFSYRTRTPYRRERRLVSRRVTVKRRREALFRSWASMFAKPKARYRVARIPALYK